MKEIKYKYALVLSGGGFNGAFQIGALNYIRENWGKITRNEGEMKFDLIAGVSTGALNGAMVAMNKMDELNELWRNRIAKNGVSEIYSSDFIDTTEKSGKLRFRPNLVALMKRLIPNFKVQLSIAEKIGMLFSRRKRRKVISRILHELSTHFSKGISKFKSIADNSPLRFKLNHLLQRERIVDSKFYCGFVSLDTGEYHNVEHSEFLSEQDFKNGVLASTAMPMIWSPVNQVTFQKNGKTHISHNNVDGGVRNISPLGDLIQHINQDTDAVYQIIVINCHNEVIKPEHFGNKGIGELTARSVYEIAFNEIFRNDVQHLLETNYLNQQAKAWDGEIQLFNSRKQPIRSFNCVVINPGAKTDLGNALVANEALIKLRMESGYLSALQAFSNSENNPYN